MSTTPVVSASLDGSAVPTWKITFDERIVPFAKILGMPEQRVRDILADLGVTGEDEQSLVIIESEEFLPMGDLRLAFVDSKLTQIARLRAAMPHLRGATRIENVAPSTNGENSIGDVAGAIKNLADANVPKGDWNDRKLLEAYDEDATEVGEVLRKRSKGRYCIVFKKDGTVNVEISLGLLRTAKRQHTSDQHRVSGQVVRVYRPGEFLAKALDESPFMVGVPLVNDYCAKSDTDWTDIEQKKRVLIRIHIMKVETARLSTREMKAICKDARMDITEFSKTLSTAMLLYDELEEQDSLPKLKIMPGDTKQSVISSDKDTGFGT